MNTLELIIKALDKNFATDIVAIDMELVSPLFSTFVICSASNPRLMNAIKENVDDELAKHDIFARSIEGNKESTWILMDYHDIVIHIFNPDERKNYNLEKLWGDQHQIDISAYLGENNDL